MKVLLAEKCGFCPGVKNAIRMARDSLAGGKKIYSLGPIIHNQDVVDELAEAGLTTVESVDEIDDGAVLIRSHGATEQQLQELRSRGLKIIDATCVLVKRIQQLSRALREEGYQVVIIGDQDHPEVQAVVGSTEGAKVIADENDVDKFWLDRKLGVICQTTQSPDHFADLLGALARTNFTELKVINTLCREAVKRQQAAVELCQKVDIMFVLGGKHSANTRKLAELCKKYNNVTFHLQNWSELDTNALCGKKTAGVTAGASTPDEVINEFVQNLRNFSSQL